MKKWIILIALIVVVGYFVLWQTSFETELKKLNELDKKILGNAVLPDEEKLAEYKAALKEYLEEIALKADSMEKKAVKELVNIKLESIKLQELKKEQEQKANLVNLIDPECLQGGAEANMMNDFLKGIEEVEKVNNKIKVFEKKYPEYYAKAEKLQELKDTLVGFENYFYNSIELIKSICGWQ